MQWTRRLWGLLWSTRIRAAPQCPQAYSTVGPASSSTGGALATAFRQQSTEHPEPTINEATQAQSASTQHLLRAAPTRSQKKRLPIRPPSRRLPKPEGRD